jgi:hypothetical protein
VAELPAIRGDEPRIRGILGQSALARLEYTIDYARRRLVVHGAYGGATAPGAASPAPRPVLDAKLGCGGASLRLVLDSGIAAPILFERSGRPLGLALGSSVRVETNAGTAEWREARVDALCVAGVRVRPTERGGETAVRSGAGRGRAAAEPLLRARARRPGRSGRRGRSLVASRLASRADAAARRPPPRRGRVAGHRGPARPRARPAAGRARSEPRRAPGARGARPRRRGRGRAAGASRREPIRRLERTSGGEAAPPVRRRRGDLRRGRALLCSRRAGLGRRAALPGDGAEPLARPRPRPARRVRRRGVERVRAGAAAAALGRAPRGRAAVPRPQPGPAFIARSDLRARRPVLRGRG